MVPDKMIEQLHLDDIDAQVDRLDAESLIRELLLKMGEDPEREGLLKTPGRVDRSLAFLTAGYRMRLHDIINDAIFHESGSEMILVRDIEFYSMCEHHMLPFFGVAHVGYIPDGRVIGLSKIPRIVELFARRLQLQERLTRQVAECIQEVLAPKGVAVITQARHLCMMMRGVEKQSSMTAASSMLGVFHDNPHTRSEFLALLGGRG